MNFRWVGIFLLLPLFGAGQTLFAPEKNPMFSDASFFNEAFVKQHNIRTITGSILKKAEMSAIVDPGTVIYFEFDTNGRLIKQYSTLRKKDAAMDTIMNLYEYDTKGQLLVKRSADAYGFYSYRYEYDANGNPTRESYYRETNKNKYPSTFKLDREYLIADEKYVNTINGDEVNRAYINEVNRKYKERTIRHEGDKLVYDSERLVVTGTSQTATYSYDEQGRLAKKFHETKGSWNQKQRYEYIYVDKILDTEKVFSNDELDFTREYIYHDSGVIKSQLNRYIETNRIEMIKYTVDYF